MRPDKPVCHKCQRIIKGRYIRTSPPAIDIMLNRAWPWAYHPSCYAKARIDNPSLPAEE